MIISNQKLEILNKLKKGQIEALEYLFKLYSKSLYYHALKFINTREVAEEIVQDVFVAIWKNRLKLEIHTSFEAYLFSSVKNRAISYLRKEITSVGTEELSKAENLTDDYTNSTSMEFNELENELNRVIDSLPERCKLIFNLSRNSGLTYKQIADELDISPESVKTQIGIALQKLKVCVKKIME